MGVGAGDRITAINGYGMIRQPRQRVVTILGTRPELVKCAPLLPRFDALFEHRLIHTGQQTGDALKDRFFREFGLRPPDHELVVSTETPWNQVAQMIQGLESLLWKYHPHWVVVQGDTNTTLAGALTASSLGLPIAHLDAGCRSFNPATPDEINRVFVDHLATLCLAPDETAVRNLWAENIPADRVVLVGSTVADACLRGLQARRATDRQQVVGEGADDDDIAANARLRQGEFLVAAIHRSENVTPERLQEILRALDILSMTWPILFIVHPRIASLVEQPTRYPRITFCEPLGHGQMLRLLAQCRGLLTDSGGLQEEAAFLGTPTFILREETAWTALVEGGYQRLIGTTQALFGKAIGEGLDGGPQELRMRIPLGQERTGATERIIDALQAFPARQAARWQQHLA